VEVYLYIPMRLHVVELRQLYMSPIDVLRNDSSITEQQYQIPLFNSFRTGIE